MIECHTPFSDPEMLNEYGDEFVLVSGLGTCVEIASEPSVKKPYGYGYRRAIDIEELFALYPESCPPLS